MRLQSLLQSIRRHHARIAARGARIRARRSSQTATVVEALEDRTLLSVITLLVDNELTILADANDSIRVSASGGQVLVEAGTASGPLNPVVLPC